MYKHETIRNQLIGYLTFISVKYIKFGNNWSINWSFTGA